MRLLYNILQLVCFPVVIAILLYRYITRKDSAFTLFNRLGFGIKAIKKPGDPAPLIWIHALSVGEVTSALPLVKALRKSIPGAHLVFSSTTTSGKTLAHKLMLPFVDGIIAFPLDLIPVVTRFLNRIQPQLFILVETDFWPNLLCEFKSRNIPAILVNGRISKKSMSRYQRYSFFFKPIFNSFSALCMQTTADTLNMVKLGIEETKVKTLGNLKYVSSPAPKNNRAEQLVKPLNHLLIICGSTHPGEEAIIFAAFNMIIKKHPHVHLALAPRNPTRTSEIIKLAENFSFSPELFTSSPAVLPEILLIDTIGDLATLYGRSDIAFIGGSLVPLGGHNPLEAARYGIPVLFGQSMDDFAEIAQELLEHQAAKEVIDSQTLEICLSSLIESEQLRQEMGTRAKRCIDLRSTIIASHLDLIKTYM